MAWEEHGCLDVPREIMAILHFLLAPSIHVHARLLQPFATS